MASLYVSGYRTRVRAEARHVSVERFDEAGLPAQRMRVPLADVTRAVVAGRVRLGVNVLHRFLRQGIGVTFATGSGRLLGTLQPPHNGSALLRLRQYELAGDPEFALGVARRLVAAKIRNSRRVLQRLSANREAPLPDVAEVIDRLEPFPARLDSAATLDELRGFEGTASALYFRALSRFFPPEIPFAQRSRRPPADAANALLSWTYTLVLGETIQTVHAAGLDVCLGFLHGIAYGRPSLALDILEPYRAPLADLLVLHILNHRILGPDHFERSAHDGGVRLKAEARKPFFLQYERVMERLFSRQKNGPHTTFRQCLRDDVYRLINAMQGGQAMEPFLMP